MGKSNKLSRKIWTVLPDIENVNKRLMMMCVCVKERGRKWSELSQTGKLPSPPHSEKKITFPDYPRKYAGDCPLKTSRRFTKKERRSKIPTVGSPDGAKNLHSSITRWLPVNLKERKRERRRRWTHTITLRYSRPSIYRIVQKSLFSKDCPASDFLPCFFCCTYMHSNSVRDLFSENPSGFAQAKVGRLYLSRHPEANPKKHGGTVPSKPHPPSRGPKMVRGSTNFGWNWDSAPELQRFFLFCF